MYCRHDSGTLPEMHKHTPSVAAAIVALADWGSGLMGYQNEVLAYVLFLTIVVLLGYGIYINSQYFQSLFRFRFLKKGRMQLLDLYKIAQEQDWDFMAQGGIEVLDFAYGLRQAGSDGEISFWGKKKNICQNLGLMGYQNEVLAYVLFLTIVVLLGYGIYINSQYFQSLFRFRFLKKGRMQLLDLYKIAQEQDWDFMAQGGIEVLDFAYGLRQAGSDGEISFWGKKKVGDFDLITRDDILRDICSAYWLGHKLDQISCLRLLANGQIAGFVDDNFHINSMPLAEAEDDLRYADIHVSRREAMKWLRYTAGQYKGQTANSEVFSIPNG